jgi:predicted amidohydrolase YtcJ
MKNSGWKVSLIIAAILCGIQFTAAQQAADTVLYNGKVLTVDRNFSVAEAVAVRDGKIAAVGRSDDVLKLAGPNTLRVDLKGRTVTPGLIDTHRHIDSAGDYSRELPAVRRVGSLPCN